MARVGCGTDEVPRPNATWVSSLEVTAAPESCSARRAYSAALSAVGPRSSPTVAVMTA
jgi:hypothetical protein